MRPYSPVYGYLAVLAACSPGHVPGDYGAPPSTFIAPVSVEPSPRSYGLMVERLPQRPAGGAWAAGGEEHVLAHSRVHMMPASADPPSTVLQILAVDAAYQRWCAGRQTASDDALLIAIGGMQLPDALACRRSVPASGVMPRRLVPGGLEPFAGRLRQSGRHSRTHKHCKDRYRVKTLRTCDLGRFGRGRKSPARSRDLGGFEGILGWAQAASKTIVARFCRLVSCRRPWISRAVGFLRRTRSAHERAAMMAAFDSCRHVPVRLTAVVLVMAAASVSAADLPSGKRFLSRGAQGWFWYEPMAAPPPEPPPAEPAPAVAVPTPEQAMPPAQVPSPAAASGPAPLSAAWFRAELERYRDLAIDHPSPENVRAYLYLQKVMLDKADGFARVSGEVAASDPYLDATTERPLAPFAANAASAEATARRSAVLADLSARSGILLIVESACAVCVRQAEVLQSLQRQYGFAILAVSLDGAAPAGLRLPVRPDAGQAARLRVIATPALYLMRPPDVILPLAQGALDQDSLVERIVAQAHRAGWIDGATYAATRPVRTPFGVPDPSSLPAEALTDPIRLVASLRATLGLADPAPAGALP